MPITMRRICVSPIRVLALVAVVVAASGCATASSLDVPWQTQTDPETAERRAESSDESAPGSGDAAVEEATFWARRAVSASNQIAYARHLRSVTERNPELFAAETRRADDAPPTGASDDERGARSGEPSPAPETRTVARTPETDTASDSEPPAEAGADSETADESVAPAASSGSDEETADDAPPPPAESSTTVRAAGREAQSDGVGAAPDNWPVALGRTYGSVPRGHAAADPSLETDVYDLSNAGARSTVADRFGIDPPESDGAVAIPGTFLQPDIFEEFRDDEFNGFDGLSDEQLQNQVAIVVPGRHIAIYAGDERIASREFSGDLELPSELTAVRPVRLVDDGTIQLLAYWPESRDGAEGVRYKAGILKAIGPFVGTLFERTVGERTADGELQRTGYVDFVHDNEQTYVRSIPADDEGSPNLRRADKLEWNPWEGVFRVPETPPTAPDQTS